MAEKQEEYMYDDYMPPETLYDKYTKIVNYPYNNNSFIRGASDKMDYEARELLNPDDPYMVSRLLGYGTAIPASIGASMTLNKRLSPAEVALGGGALAALSKFAPDDMSQKIYSHKRPEPTEDNFMYEAGKKAVPASVGYGTAKAIANKDIFDALPYYLAPVLAGMANPKYNPVLKTAEYLDKDKREK